MSALNIPIQQTEASETFKVITKLYGYHTIGDLAQQKNPYALLKHPGFRYHLLSEYAGLLEQYQLTQFIT